MVELAAGPFENAEKVGMVWTAALTRLLPACLFPPVTHWSWVHAKVLPNFFLTDIAIFLVILNY